MGRTAERGTLAGIAASALCVLAAVAVMLAPRVIGDRVLPESARDFAFHVMSVEQFRDSLLEGSYQPRWAPKTYGGLGSAVFVYYPPLYYGLTAVVASGLGVGTWTAMRMVECAALLALGLIWAYAAHRMGASPYGPVIVTVLVVCNAELVVRLYYTSSLPWLLSTVWASLVVLAIGMKGRSRTRLAIIIAGTALLALTHLLMSFMTALVIAIVAVAALLLEKDRPFRASLAEWGSKLAAFAIGAGLSSFHTIPALLSVGDSNELGYAGDLDWRGAFALPMVTAMRFGVYWPMLNWGVAAILYGCLVFGWLLASRIAADSPGASRQEVIRLLAMGTVAAFFASELSYPVWESSSVLQKVQAPTRFLSLMSISALPAVGLLLTMRQAPGKKVDWVRAGAWITASGSLCLFLALIVKIAAVDGAPAHAILERAPGSLSDMRAFLPRTFGPAWRDWLANGGFAAECDRAGATCRATRTGTRGGEWEVSTERDVRLRLPTFRFPNWQVLMDGHPLAHDMDADTGLISIRLPAGAHRVATNWRTSRAEAAGRIAAGVSVVGALLAILMLGSRRRGP